ncbi:SDR family oxidoreductase [Histomonas meleagridis]|uniref:SDR family oxidoreductase n=1 Tax=Histomonas meleagridis TaxID=135588 RepID=UPI003559A7B8|nr:SDR family oxidoreductase [Histomonas meleagridis]KAH0797354.1 SDR family oxidoreductase [Histomonas meleagridis]
MKVWFVTGTSTGIGHELVKLLLARGDKVIATSRTPEKLIASIGPVSENFLPIALDLNSEENIKSVVSKSIEHFGHIDVLVNNAGYGQNGTFEETSEESIRKNFEINFFAPLRIIREIMPHFRSRKSGTIFNVASIAAFHSFYGMGTYSAAKMALRGMTIGMRDEFKHFGVRTCCVAPGPFKTAFYDQSGQSDIVIDDYEELRKTLPPRVMKWKWEDNVKGAQLIIDANELDEIPETLFLGKVAIDVVRGDLKKINDEMDKYEEMCSHCGAEL